jgi:4-hydroxyphenylpyruvate dioxygenase-like putative hemolysin
MYYLNLLEANRRAEKRMKKWKLWYDTLFSKEETEKFRIAEKRRLRKTPKACSCWMCGNPRKHLNEITRQELQSKFKMDEELKEL